ncbi:hypothetical protein BC939DRAFT_49770 [Gamsiella multidivaricata]|uniref:uncharacterized protein n=1 Tax=Gamsiella multidivaricata TaxID=101098 RepID=UPI00221ECDC3|nr:uncharacterized protein BC939DRAFT_49770 [Gamsiella multidivaricata]KAI7828763.1 hypothetical protein BC939DRAFT_49770 [Gamsiella multidivaricata]
MESQHTLSNPWSFNQTQGRDSDDDLQHTFIKDLRFGRRRDSGDHRHYSYASSTTIAPEPFEDDSDSLFSSSPQKQSIDPDLVKRSASPIAEPEAVVASSEVEVEAEGGSHSRTWSSESDIVGSALVEAVHVNDHIQSLDNLFNSTLDRDQAPSISSMADSTALTITKMRGNDSDPSAKTLSDSGVGLETMGGVGCHWPDSRFLFNAQIHPPSPCSAPRMAVTSMQYAPIDIRW